MPVGNNPPAWTLMRLHTHAVDSLRLLRAWWGGRVGGAQDGITRAAGRAGGAT